MKKYLLIFVSDIVGINAAMVALWLDLSDNAIIATLFAATILSCLLLGVFDDDRQEPEQEHEDHTAHTHDANGLRHTA